MTHEFGQTLSVTQGPFFFECSPQVNIAIVVSQTSIVYSMIYSSIVMGDSCLLERPHGNQEWEKARNVLEPSPCLSKVHF